MNVHSTMADKVKAYVAERRHAGFALTIDAERLAQFAALTDATGYRGPLTIAIASQWALASRSGRRITAARRIETLRSFARYCRAHDGKSEIPPRHLFGPGHRRLTPHIYTAREIHVLQYAALRLPPDNGLRGQTCAAIIGLLAACGLRISEATSLIREDVDLNSGCLHIRQSKFGKARLVSLHPTAVTALRRYARRRDRDPASADCRAFFLFDHGRPACPSKVHYAFRILRQQLRQPPRGSHPRHRMHDLRHTFVCRRLQRWYEEGLDIDQQLFALSTYLGHTGPAETYWYVTATPQLMAIAAQRLAPLPMGEPR